MLNLKIISFKNNINDGDSMKYLIFTDYDNTLAYNSNLSPKTIDGISKIVKNNKLCILSFNSFDSMLNNLNNLNCDFFSFSSNKGIINNKAIMNNISFKVINELFNKFNSYIYTFYAQNEEKTYIKNYQERLSAIYPKKNQVIIDNLDEDIESAFFAVGIEKADNFNDMCKNLCLEVNIIAKDKNRELVILKKNELKKKDIFKLCKKIYKNYETIGIGDSIEDLEFISLCDKKIAMKNGDAKLKKECDITTSFDSINDGCITALLEIIQ